MKTSILIFAVAAVAIFAAGCGSKGTSADANDAGLKTGKNFTPPAPGAPVKQSTRQQNMAAGVSSM